MRTVAGVAVAGLLAACGGSEAAEAPTPTPEAEVTVAPTETEEPSPEPTERDILADPENDAREPEDGLVGILRFRDALFTAPDPEKLTLAYAEDCLCYETLYQGMKDLADTGRRAEILRERTIADIEVVETEGPVVTLRYRTDVPALRLYGPDGEVLEESDGDTELRDQRATIVLRGGRWIVLDTRKVEG